MKKLDGIPYKAKYTPRPYRVNGVAVFIARTKTIHAPDCKVHTYMKNILVLKSWTSAEGRHARVVGKACKVCNPVIPALVGDYEPEPTHDNEGYHGFEAPRESK